MAREPNSVGAFVAVVVVVVRQEGSFVFIIIVAVAKDASTGTTRLWFVVVRSQEASLAAGGIVRNN